MKSKQNVSSQIMILAMAALVIVFMIQVARAQDISSIGNVKLAQGSSNQSQVGSGIFSNGQSGVLSIKLPQKSLGRKILENTTLSYYQQFLGPTLQGRSNETYNVFQEGMDAPGTGRAPLQSFHAVNLRYQFNSNWAMGASLAATNGYTKEVENRGGIVNNGDSLFYNARVYVTLPAWETSLGSLSSTVSYEAPTSTISRNDDMTWGVVVTESFTFRSSNPRWTYGLLGQYYRVNFDHKDNVKPPTCDPGFICTGTSLQTVIISGGPFASYRFNDNWQAGSSITLDWDQRGPQSGSREYNNNLPHRGRLGLSYFPNKLKYLTSVGVFTQALLKFRPETTAVGAEFAVKF